MQTFLEHFAAIRDALDGIGLWDDADGIFYDRLLHARGHGADQGAVDRVDDPDAGGRRRQWRTAGRHALGDQAVRPVPAPPRPGRARAARRGRAAARHRRQHAALSCPWSGSTGSRRCSPRCSTRPSSSRRTGCGRSRRATAPTRPCCEFGGLYAERGLRARGVDDRDVRRQLQLARAGVVPGELPRRRARSTATTASSATTSRSSTRPARGSSATLDRIADDLRARLVSLFLAGPDGRRPFFGGVEKMQTDPRWRDQILFYEYFHGDNGAGLAPPTRPAGRAWWPT